MALVIPLEEDVDKYIEIRDRTRVIEGSKGAITPMCFDEGKVFFLF